MTGSGVVSRDQNKKEQKRRAFRTAARYCEQRFFLFVISERKELESKHMGRTGFSRSGAAKGLPAKPSAAGLTGRRTSSGMEELPTGFPTKRALLG